jgi:hypothetical protein
MYVRYNQESLTTGTQVLIMRVKSDFSSQGGPDGEHTLGILPPRGSR